MLGLRFSDFHLIPDHANPGAADIRLAQSVGLTYALRVIRSTLASTFGAFYTFINNRVVYLK